MAELLEAVSSLKEVTILDTKDLVLTGDSKASLGVGDVVKLSSNS